MKTVNLVVVNRSSVVAFTADHDDEASARPSGYTYITRKALRSLQGSSLVLSSKQRTMSTKSSCRVVLSLCILA